jgi:hypothetical protein
MLCIAGYMMQEQISAVGFLNLCSARRNICIILMIL